MSASTTTLAPVLTSVPPAPLPSFTAPTAAQTTTATQTDATRTAATQTDVCPTCQKPPATLITGADSCYDCKKYKNCKSLTWNDFLSVLAGRGCTSTKASVLYQKCAKTGGCSAAEARAMEDAFPCDEMGTISPTRRRECKRCSKLY